MRIFLPSCRASRGDQTASRCACHAILHHVSKQIALRVPPPPLASKAAELVLYPGITTCSGAADIYNQSPISLAILSTIGELRRSSESIGEPCRVAICNVLCRVQLHPSAGLGEEAGHFRVGTRRTREAWKLSGGEGILKKDCPHRFLFEESFTFSASL